MNNIFTEMRIPQLGDPSFQTDFTAFCNAMKQNIERLISVHYVKGEPGNSVYTTQVHVGYSPAAVLTSISASMLNAIFDCQDFDQSLTRSDVYNIIAGTDDAVMLGSNDYFTNGGIAPSIVIGGNHYDAVPTLMGSDEGFDIDINVDKVTGEAYLASPYIFIDNRITGLNSIFRRYAHDEEIYKTFHDFSVAVYGKGTYQQGQGQDIDNPITWNWEFVTVPIVPKLYFDDHINEFCWNVNGQETGITAQGIKGDDGVSPNMIIAIGVKQGNIIIFNKIQVVDDGGNINWAEKDAQGIWGYDTGGEHVVIEQPKPNDIVLVFFPGENQQNTSPFEYAFFGKTYIGATGACTYIGSDNEGRCDIFESIKLHDYWRLMLTINSYTTGAPRGYILPANTNNILVDPDTLPDEVHMTYSERRDADDQGFGKLHSAPILRGNPDPTRMSQTEDPQADHIGDWQIDYNMDIRGNAAIQGDTYVQGNMGVQGSMGVQGDFGVQGDMTVQGAIIGQGITVIGQPFGTVIGTPKIACMSRFKDVSYSLKRSINTSAKKFGYTVVISGVLELNIGVLSWFNQSDCISKPHEAISGYGANWGTQGTHAQAPNIDTQATEDFGNTECKQRSKLYNVVKYEIPFDISKSVESGSCYSGNGGVLANNIFGFGRLQGNTQLCDTPRTLYQYKNNQDEISLRTIVEGFNKKFANSNGGYDVYGSDIVKTTDIDGTMYWDIKNDATMTLDELTQQTQIDATKTVGPYTAQGAISGIVAQRDGTRNIPTTTAMDKYAFHGKLRYAPYSMTFEYYFDLFTRIFEVDYTAWEQMLVYGNSHYYCSDMDYNIFLDITPVGFVRCKYNNKEFHAPIWNAINVNNEGSNSIRSNISRLNVTYPHVTVVDDQIVQSVGGGNSNTVQGGDVNSEENESSDPTPSRSTPNSDTPDRGMSTSSTPPEPEDPTSITYERFYTLANALVSNLYTETFSDDKPSSVINGPQSVILFGENVESQYIIGVFDNPTPSNQIECLSVENLSANYFDLTPSLRFVENNIKICPNNVYMGTWRLNTGENKIRWESSEPVPVVIIPYEGYIGTYNANNYRGYVKIGCGNLKPQASTQGAGEPVTLNGVLMYPFTPCIIMKTSSQGAVITVGIPGTPGTQGIPYDDNFNEVPITDGPSDRGGRSSDDSHEITYTINAIEDWFNDALSNGQHLLSNGRMMVTDGQVSGMITLTRKHPPIVPNDWAEVEVIVDQSPEQNDTPSSI